MMLAPLRLARSRSGLFGDGLQKAPAGLRDFRHSPVERWSIDFSRLMKAADLADELKRRGVQLLGGSRLAWLAQHLNASAHVLMIAQIPAARTIVPKRLGASGSVRFPV
jgi:hypothetical protein